MKKAPARERWGLFFSSPHGAQAQPIEAPTPSRIKAMTK